MPVEKRNVIEQEDEIVGFLKQSHISSRNIKRLELLKTSPDPQIAELAEIVKGSGARSFGKVVTVWVFRTSS
jgi:hypothetical protein